MKKLTLALALFLAACSGGDSASAPADGTAQPATTAPNETTPEASRTAEATEKAAEAEPVDMGPTMTLQAEGSALSFIARKNDEADVPGKLTNLGGTLQVPGGDLSKATGTIEIGWVGGVDTENPARDNSIITVFFGALDEAAPKGQVSLNSLEVQTPSLDVGQSTSGNAFVDVGAGVSMTGLAVPVTVTRNAESQYTFALGEGVEVSIERLGMNDRKATLMQVCQHKSVSDAVKMAGIFVFGQ